ncbi:phosphoglucomutase/phosphomannomutase family protein [Carboxydochorda subterranea]|uniref:Phosphoglucomutase n=1 Tax=Carboxydichorda subterranea TaxID=3109565 RepID=A0ABZ1C1U0_9FIRM|nr:phosphoglucomutase/phosphomannomutase family protein [Limnochorda sp. L945t]WRP18884.1 phosphoglucomutase/phosphomannomutase family protein [Limnochorda sp. L945t]
MPVWGGIVGTAMQARPIRFGTDGWREVIADGYTFERVRIVAAAIARYLRETGTAARGVAVGYDARFLSDRFARAVAEVLAGAGIPVWLSTRQVPTPALAVAVVQRHLGGGVMITASHNPPEFNGVKFKPPYGGSATEAITRPVEAWANEMLVSGQGVERLALDRAIEQGLVRPFDPVEPYLERILTLVDTQAIARAGLAVVTDPMHGAARGVLAQALRRAGCRTVHAIREEANPGFGGVNPEPIEANLEALQQSVRALGSGVHAGFAVDGDGDRIGMVDETGRFVNAHQIFALLLMHLVEHRGLRGEVVKTVSTTSMVDQLASRYGLPLVETPVGFKYVCARMLEADVLIGGEESGGIGVRGHIPERDGIVSALLMAELMAGTGRTARQLVEWLEGRVGPHRYGRLDLHLEETADLGAVRRHVSEWQPDVVAGTPVVEAKRTDGLKLLLQDGSWVMLRASGTEPLVRIYAEAPDDRRVRALLEAGRHWVAQAHRDVDAGRQGQQTAGPTDGGR